MKTELISFYCDVGDYTYYSDHAFRIKEECFRLNLPHDFRKVRTENDYRLNCLRKPKYILSMLEEKKKPIVWIDIDSQIHRDLTGFDRLLEHEADLGFAYFVTDPSQINVLQPKASPIFCNYNEKVINFLKMWIQKCEDSVKKNEKLFDHEILLFKVLPFLANQLKIGCLPMNYCVWPGKCPEGMEPYITMGIADHKSKEENLKEFANVGMSESEIRLNLNRI
jgi:hypothetical protein